jgi:ATP-binding cassette subfamily F protein uup
MEDVLDGWAGTLLVVSHDRYLLERMTDRQVAMLGDGSLRDLPGGVEQYLELRRAREGRKASASAAQSAGPTGSAVRTDASPARQRDARKALDRLDRQLAQIARQEDEVHTQMVAAATDATVMTRLSGELSALHARRAALEDQWLEAAELAEP